MAVQEMQRAFPIPPIESRIMLEMSTGGQAMTLGEVFELAGQVCLGACFLYMAALIYFFIVDGAFRGGF